MALLELKDLKVSYGAIDAVKGINIKVEEGQIVAILGSNGAGKTSTLKSISGIAKSSGQIIFDGKDIANLNPVKITNMGIIQSPEGRQIFPDLSVEDNLITGAFTLKNRKKLSEKLQYVYNKFPRLAERKSQFAGTLSGGEQQMLAISRALMCEPKLIILDEPSLGLAPLIVQDIMDMIKEIKSSNTTVLIVEQNALQTLKIADYAYVLEIGEISIEGKGSDLVNDKKLIEAYLGGH